MTHIAIVEDDPTSSARLKQYIEQYGGENGAAFAVKLFSNGAVITENYRPVWDIFFMDIVMQGFDGMAAAREIRRTDPSVLILFITNQVQYSELFFRGMNALVRPEMCL